MRSARRIWAGCWPSAGLSFQRTRTWKASPDPDYEAKAARVLELRAAPPADGGAVIAFDQMGPISLRPMAGSGWAPAGRPERQRATYNRRHGVRYVMGAYDVHDDRLRVRLRPRRRGSDNLAFMAQIRAAIPARRRIYWIQDNLSANWTPDIRAFAAATKIDLVATPTYASYLNPVECHFFPISRVRRQQRRLRRLGRLRLGAGPPRPAPQRPAPSQTHPPARSPSPDRRLMAFPVKRSEKGQLVVPQGLPAQRQHPLAALIFAPVGPLDGRPALESPEALRRLPRAPPPKSRTPAARSLMTASLPRTAGCRRLNWPHCGRLKWPHLRPG